MSDVTIVPAEEKDIPGIAAINAKVFLGNRDDPVRAEKWVRGLFKCDHYRYFVARDGDKVVAFIGWQLHGGYARATPAVELEQIGVDPGLQKSGLGTRLMMETADLIMQWVMKENDRIEDNVYFFCWCHTMNTPAMKTYQKWFTEIAGSRTQFGPRHESMWRRAMPRFRHM